MKGEEDMKKLYGSRRLFAAVVIATPLLMSVTQAGPADLMQTAKKAMEGTWRLEQWQVGDRLLSPPQADGRASIHDGVNLVLLHWSADGSRKSLYGYGTYSLSNGSWTYGYDRYLAYTEGPSGITVSERPPFEGRRTYAISTDGQKVKLDNDNGRWQLIFEGDVLTYLDNGKLLRKWRRVPAD
jgi:hypothetical protein